MTENRYKIGEVVCERIRPAQKLRVKRFEKKIYHCSALENKAIKNLVFTERELMTVPVYPI